MFKNLTLMSFLMKKLKNHAYPENLLRYGILPNMQIDIHETRNTTMDNPINIKNTPVPVNFKPPTRLHA